MAHTAVCLHVWAFHCQLYPNASLRGKFSPICEVFGAYFCTRSCGIFTPSSICVISKCMSVGRPPSHFALTRAKYPPATTPTHH